MSCNKPNWLLLKECAEELTKRGETPFTRKQLIDRIHKEHPDKREDSLNPIIQGMTVNLKGGAPGGIGKDVFYSIGRGLFELYDPKKHSCITNTTFPVNTEENPIELSVDEKAEKAPADVERKTTEDKIRDLLMQILYYRVGREESWKGHAKTASFDLKEEFKGYKCFAECPLTYVLPSGIELAHNNDVLISSSKKKRYISIEIKHRSAVTDQFKCRAYDMFHLKRKYGDNLLGIMVYVKSTTGISADHAKSICYSFDYFFCIPSESKHDPRAWDELISVVVSFLKYD